MTLWQDVLYGFRILLKKPGFTLIAALSLGLGIGANSTIFSLISGTLLQQMPYPAADRVTVLWTKPLNRPDQRNGVSGINYRAWAQRSQLFASMGGVYQGTRTLGGEQNGAPAEQINGAQLTASIFDVFGMKPLRGRVFTAEEDRDGNAAPVVLLSYKLWQRRFNGEEVIGKTVLLDNVKTYIIGVMPEHFGLPGDDSDYWAPIGFIPQQLTSQVGFLTVLGRLKPGVSVNQAQQEMDSIANGLRDVLPNNKNNGVRVDPVQEAFYNGLKRPLFVLQSTVAFVLLIACANVAGLLLARAGTRRTEIAVRTSIGAARGRIVRQLLTESVLLALIGGILGIAFAWAGLRLIFAELPPGALDPGAFRLDGRSLLFTAAVSIVTGLLFGLMPALQTSKVDLASTLKESGRGGSDGAGRQRARGALVAFQIGLALVLLMGAGLMMNSFLNIQKNDLGGDPNGLLTFELRFSQTQLMKPVGTYRGFGLWEINPVVGLTYQRLYERLRTMPGVLSAAAASRAPFQGAMGMSFRIPGRPEPPPDPQGGGNGMRAAYMPISPGYFATLKTPVLQGRDFNDGDTAAGPRVVIINQTLAKRFWPNENPVGQNLVLDFVPNEVPRQVVGVVGDLRLSQAQKDVVPIIYLPHLQQTVQWQGPSWGYRAGMNYIVRTAGNPLRLTTAVQRAVADIDSSKVPSGIRTVDQVLRDQGGGRRVYMLLLTIFGVIAGILAAVGIYGVMAYAVVQRTREIGIRMALGASSTNVVRLIVRQALLVVGIGLVLGLAGSFVCTRFIADELYGVTPTDPRTFLTVSAGVVIVAVIASLVPTLRAVRTDPTIALRYE
ncbi:MAG: ABC transporter permease [Acidobacteriia bacterium]|nr:ABC transporter permease [Terriglobia bacterium]